MLTYSRSLGSLPSRVPGRLLQTSGQAAKQAPMQSCGKVLRRLLGRVLGKLLSGLFVRPYSAALGRLLCRPLLGILLCKWPGRQTARKCVAAPMSKPTSRCLGTSMVGPLARLPEQNVLVTGELQADCWADCWVGLLASLPGGLPGKQRGNTFSRSLRRALGTPQKGCTADHEQSTWKCTWHTVGLDRTGSCQVC